MITTLSKGRLIIIALPVPELLVVLWCSCQVVDGLPVVFVCGSVSAIFVQQVLGAAGAVSRYFDLCSVICLIGF